MASAGPDVDGGDYLGPTKRNETAGPAGAARASSVARDEALAARLWDLSVEMTGIDPEL